MERGGRDRACCGAGPPRLAPAASCTPQRARHLAYAAARSGAVLAAQGSGAIVSGRAQSSLPAALALSSRGPVSRTLLRARRNARVTLRTPPHGLPVSRLPPRARRIARATSRTPPYVLPTILRGVHVRVLYSAPEGKGTLHAYVCIGAGWRARMSMHATPSSEGAAPFVRICTLWSGVARTHGCARHPDGLYVNTHVGRPTLRRRDTASRFEVCTFESCTLHLRGGNHYARMHWSGVASTRGCARHPDCREGGGPP